MSNGNFSKNLIKIDPQIEADNIIAKLRNDIAKKLKKRGVVIGVSGGIDSSILLALCAKAFGNKKVFAISMPEQDSSADNFIMTEKLCTKYDISYIIEDMTPALYGFNTYLRRDEAIRNIFPEYNMSYKAKIGLPNNMFDKDTLNVFYITIISPEGEEKTTRLPFKEYLQIVAASNFKQRSRMSMLYYHAERLNYAVIGTGNKNEHEMGFFVKYGDGGADIKPIAHLFKTQVFQLAEYLEIPMEIQERTPTTDTYSAEQTQEEFFFRLPFKVLDIIWDGWEKGFSEKEMANELDLSEDQIHNIINDIKRKLSTTEYLRMEPL